MGDQCNDSDQEHVHAVPSRRDALIAGAALVAAPFLGRVISIVQAAQGANTVLRVGSPVHAQAGKVQGTATEWLSYGGDKARSKNSPPPQKNGDHLPRLRVPWTLRSARARGAKAQHLNTQT